MDLFVFITKFATFFHLFVSLPIYLSVLAFLLRQRHRPPFTSSFYMLFIALGFVDLSKFLLYIVKKCAYWGYVTAIFYPLNQANGAANLIYFLLWTLGLIQFQLNFLMSLNRFCAICCSQMYRRHWSPKISKYLLAIIFLFALAIAAPILWHSVCFRLSEVRTPFGQGQHKMDGPVFMEIPTQQIYYTITKMFAISHLAFLLFAYPLMCRRIRQMNLKQRSHRVEVRMCYAIILLSIANLLFAIYLITWEILSRRHAELSPIAEWILLMIVDFYDLNSPYGLIITSKIILNAIINRDSFGYTSPKIKKKRKSSTLETRASCAYYGLVPVDS